MNEPLLPVGAYLKSLDPIARKCGLIELRPDVIREVHDGWVCAFTRKQAAEIRVEFVEYIPLLFGTHSSGMWCSDCGCTNAHAGGCSLYGR